MLVLLTIQSLVLVVVSDQRDKGVSPLDGVTPVAIGDVNRDQFLFARDRTACVPVFSVVRKVQSE